MLDQSPLPPPRGGYYRSHKGMGTKPILVFVAAALLAGCAGAGDCAGDWFATGQRDGMLNAGSQAARYAARCPGPVDTAKYEEGYSDGFSRRGRIAAF